MDTRQIAFYRQFLDETLTLSCAEYANSDDSLIDAQTRKLDNILSSLEMDSSKVILDIGCGLGSLVRRASEKYESTAIGINTSTEQIRFCNERKSEKETYLQCDIFGFNGNADAISCIEVLEYIEQTYYDRIFEKCSSLLNKDGRMFLQFQVFNPKCFDRNLMECLVNCRDNLDPVVTPDYGEVLRLAQKHGLVLLNKSILEKQYSYTAKAWQEGIKKNIDSCIDLVGVKEVEANIGIFDCLINTTW